MSLAPTRLENFPLASPDSAGIPDNVRDHMLIAPFNDADFASQIIAEYSDEIAAVIVEPLQRLIPPMPGFLETLREVTCLCGTTDASCTGHDHMTSQKFVFCDIPELLVTRNPNL